MLDGGRRITGCREGTHEPERYARTESVARGESPPPHSRTDEVRGRFSLIRQLLQSRHVAPRQSLAFRLEPALELGSTNDVKAIEHLTSIELDGVSKSTGVERFLEVSRVTPHVCPVDAQRIAVAAHESMRAEGLTEDVDRLAQRVASVLRIVLGPKERDERVAPMGAARRGKRKVGEQRDAFGLRED